MRISTLAALLLSLTFLLTHVAEAQYMKIEGIKGESTTDGHKEWIDLLSVSQSITRTAAQTGQTRRRGGATMSPVTVTKPIDSATPMLMRAAANGEVIPSVEIQFTSPGGRRALKYRLENVTVTSVTHQADQNETREEVAFNYEKIRFEYPKPSGENVTFMYDIKSGKSN